MRHADGPAYVGSDRHAGGAPGRNAARELVAQALTDLELALRSVRDATALEVGQRHAGDRAAGLRAALLELPRDAAPEFPAGWRAAVLRAGELAFGARSPEVEALERLGGSKIVPDRT